MLKKRGRVQLFRCTTKVGRTEFPLLIPKRDNNAKVEVKFSRIIMQQILENRQSCVMSMTLSCTQFTRLRIVPLTFCVIHSDCKEHGAY